jgi:CYTH domain-containing protein
LDIQAFGQKGSSMKAGKYARVERERRFLLAAPPPPEAMTGRRQITDRYLRGTRLRLRRVDWADGRTEFKFTQKIPAEQPGYLRGLITNTYLSPAEYDLLAALPADELTKTRWSAPPLAIDLFDPPRHGLVLAEAEFATDEAAEAFAVPEAAVAEVTSDDRFAGGTLARTGRPELLSWLSEFSL